MRRRLLRVLLLAGLLAAVIEREVLAARDIWCRWDFYWPYHRSWQETVVLLQVFPGALVTKPELRTPTSRDTLVAVGLGALVWAFVLSLLFLAIGRVLRRRGRRLPEWRPWLTGVLAATTILVAGRDLQLRASDLRAVAHCQDAIARIPPGATRADVRVAIREARPAGGEIADEDVFDPAARRIDIWCSETYGIRAVTMHVHVAGDVVVRVDRVCVTYESCDVIAGHECGPGDL